MLTFALFVTVSGMLAPEKTGDLSDSLKKYETKYEEQYQQDLKERMDAAEKMKQDEQPKEDPEELDAPELKPDPEELDATPQPAVPHMDEAMDALSGALAAHGESQDAADQGSVDQALEKLKTSAKMMVVLHVLMKPISTKLHLAMQKMGDADKSKAQDILDHLGELDGLSAKAVDLLKHVDTVKHGTPEERKEALEHLLTGMKDIQTGVTTHLLAMRRPTAAENPVHLKGKLPALTAKLHDQIRRMEDKVNMELADPARKDDPLVKMDIEVLDTMKTAVKKAESLVVVAAVAMKQAKTEDQKTKIKHAIKAELQDVMTKLKQDMSHLKEKTVIVEAVNKLKDAGGLQGLLANIAAKNGNPAKEHPDAEASVDADGNTEPASEEAPSADGAASDDGAAAAPSDDDAAAAAAPSDDDAPAGTDDGAAAAPEPQGDDSAAAEPTTKDEDFADDKKPEKKDKEPARPPASDGKFDKLLDQLDALKSSFKNKDSANLRKNAAEEDA